MFLPEKALKRCTFLREFWVMRILRYYRSTYTNAVKNFYRKFFDSRAQFKTTYVQSHRWTKTRTRMVPQIKTSIHHRQRIMEKSKAQSIALRANLQRKHIKRKLQRSRAKTCSKSTKQRTTGFRRANKNTLKSLSKQKTEPDIEATNHRRSSSERKYLKACLAAVHFAVR